MTPQTEHLIYSGLRGAVLDVDDADKRGEPLPLEMIEMCRDILSGVLDRHKKELAA